MMNKFLQKRSQYCARERTGRVVPPEDVNTDDRTVYDIATQQFLNSALRTPTTGYKAEREKIKNTKQSDIKSTKAYEHQ